MEAAHNTKSSEPRQRVLVIRFTAGIYPTTCLICSILPCLRVTRKVYKFVGVNVTHQDFIKRYARLGPRELTSPPRLEGKEMEAMTCDKLAHCLLLRTSHDPNARTKFEVGKTKIFIRYAERVCRCSSNVRDSSFVARLYSRRVFRDCWLCGVCVRRLWGIK